MQRVNMRVKILHKQEELMNIKVRVVAAQQRTVHSYYLQDTRKEKDLINRLHGPLPRKGNLTSKVEKERGKGKATTTLLFVVTILSSISMTVTHLSQ